MVVHLRLCRQKQTPQDLPEGTQGRLVAFLPLEQRRDHRARSQRLEEEAAAAAEDQKALRGAVQRAVAVILALPRMALPAASLAWETPRMAFPAGNLAWATMESERLPVPSPARSRAWVTRESGTRPEVCPADQAVACHCPAALPVVCQLPALECQLPVQGCRRLAVEWAQQNRTGGCLLEAFRLFAKGSQPTRQVACPLQQVVCR